MSGQKTKTLTQLEIYNIKREKWRRAERHAEIAQFFFGKRAVTRGREGGDVISPFFRVEWVYYRYGCDLTNKLYGACHEAQQENKIAVVALSDPRRRGFAILCHSSQLIQLARTLHRLQSKGILSPEEVDVQRLPQEEKQRRHKVAQEEKRAIESIAAALQPVIVEPAFDPEDAIL